MRDYNWAQSVRTHLNGAYGRPGCSAGLHGWNMTKRHVGKSAHQILQSKHHFVFMLTIVGIKKKKSKDCLTYLETV